MIRPGGIPRIDESLGVWIGAFLIVASANYLALFDSHWHHLPQGLTGHPPIPHGTWIQWWLTNSCTLGIYSVTGILVLHRISMRLSAGVAVAVCLFAAAWLWRKYDVI